MMIKLGNEEIDLNADLLKFDELSLNKFFQTFASNYSIYQEYHARAQYLHSKCEDIYDAIYAEKFKQYREESSSDKMAEMKTKIDKEVQEALENVRIAKHKVNSLWGFLRSMDRAHDDALNLGYNVRKEMDKMFPNYPKKPDYL